MSKEANFSDPLRTRSGSPLCCHQHLRVDSEYKRSRTDDACNGCRRLVGVKGGNGVREHIHPHIDSNGSICWGNIGDLVHQLSSKLDLTGLFQLVLQFLHSYNEGDAYERIERWDPSWDEDEEDSSYCSYCDEFGHTTEDCAYCFWCESCERWVDSDGHDCAYEEDTEEEEINEPSTTEEDNEPQLVEVEAA